MPMHKYTCAHTVSFDMALVFCGSAPTVVSSKVKNKAYTLA